MSADRLILAWAELQKAATVPDVGPYLYLQLASGSVPIGAILRVSDKRAGLLVRFPSADSHRIPKTESGRGYTIERPVHVSGDTMGLPILLGDPGAAEIFAAMGADLVSHLNSTESQKQPVEAVWNRLRLWKRFLQKRVSLLSEEECRGLFGELHVFGLVSRVDGIDVALEAWQGPLSGLQDFAFNDCFIEVKTCHCAAGSRVMISDPSQIVVDSMRPIFLSVVQLVLNSPSGATLGDKVAEVRVQMSPLQAQRFDELLAGYGFIASQAAEYPQRMLASHVSTFQVRSGFPHIQPQSIPGGVVAVKYAIEVGALDPFRATNVHIQAP